MRRKDVTFPRAAGAGVTSQAAPHPRPRLGHLSTSYAATALALITVLAAGLRFWRLGAIPPGFHYDEALEALEAWRVLTVPGYHPLFFPGDFGLAPTMIYLSSLAFRFLPAVPTVSRSIAALIGTATVPAVYALGRELVLADDRVPPATPLLAAAVLAGLRWHINFSRVAIEPILVPLYLVVVLWALFCGLRTNRTLAWLGLGVALGLSVYAYPAAWLLLPLVVAIVVYLSVADRLRVAGRGRGLSLAGVVALLIIAPLALYFLQHPQQVLMRTDQVAVVGAAQPLGETLASVGSNLLKALGMFSVAGDSDPRSNIPGVPALDPLLSIPFYLGLILVLWRWKRPAAGTLLLAGAAMLANTVFSQYAPHFRRALGLTPVVALISGLGLGAMVNGHVPERIAGFLRRPTQPGFAAAGAWRQGARYLVVAALLGGSTLLSGVAYFVEWGRSPDLFYAYDEGLWQIASYARSLSPGQDIFVTPRPGGDATLAFAWRAGPSVRHFDGRSAMIVAPQTRDATYIVIEHEDFRSVGLLTQLFPNAGVDETFLDRRGKTYATAWRVPAGSVPVRRPQVAVDASWPAIDLIGYDLDRPAYHAGDIVYLQLWWRATAAPATDWTVFTHLLGAPKADGSTLWAGKDGRPGEGSASTRSWQAGDLILDEYQIQLGADLPPGGYQLEAGLYDPAAGGQRAIMTNPPGQEHFILGQIRVQ